MDYRKLYEENAEYKRFVDKAMNDHGYTLERALRNRTLQDVGDYFAEKKDGTYVSCETMKSGGC